MVRPMEDYSTILDKDHLVDQVEEIDSVGYQDASLLGKLTHEDTFENLLLYIGIQGGNWVVH